LKRSRGRHRYIKSVAAVTARCCGGSSESNAHRLLAGDVNRGATVSELASSPSNTAASANAGDERSEEQA
jgi:hypothetical protein